MKKLFRILIIIASTLFTILGITLIFAPKFLNTDAFKHNIESILMTQLQRVIKIEDVSISFLPDINLHLSGFTMGDAKGFDSIPQLYIPSTSIYLEIWPLFHKKIVFKRIFFDGLKLNLCQNKNSKNNWEDLLNVISSQKQTSQNSIASDTSVNSFSLLTLGSLAIKDAKILLDDRLNNHKVKISHLTYQCAGLLRNIIQLSFDISGEINHEKKTCRIDSHVDINGRATLLFKNRRYSIDDANLKVDSTALLSDGSVVKSLLDAKIAFSPDHGALELSDMAFQINDMSIQGDVYVRNLFDLPSFSGHVNINRHDIFETFFYFEKPVGFDGPVSSELTFQTQGNTFSSLLNSLDMNMLINMGAGTLVLPVSNSGSSTQTFSLLNNSKIQIHLKQIVDLLKNEQENYIFQTSFNGNFEQINSELDLQFKTQANIILDKSSSYIIIDNGKFDIHANWKKLPGNYALKGNISGDIKEKNILIKNAVLTGPNVNARFQSHLSYPNEQYIIQNHMDFKIQDLRNILSAFSIEMPQFYNSKSFHNIAFQGDVKLTPDHLNLKTITFNLDEALMKGDISVQYHPPRIDLNLLVDKLNFDKYWIKRKKNENKKIPQKNNSIVSKEKKETFYNPEINAKLEFKDLKYCNLSFDQMSTNIKGKEGLYRFSPTSGNLYKGMFTGRWTLDFRPETPKTTALFQCKNIQIGDYLTDYIKYDRIHGKLNMKASLSSDLDGFRIDKSTMNGNAKLALTDGVINGILIVPTVVQKEIFEIHKKSKSSLGSIKKQQFVNKMTGLVTFRNGIMHNSNLKVSAERLRVKGKGAINWVKHEVDYNLYVRIGNFPIIPYQVKGSMSNPHASLKKSEFLKTAVSGFFNQAGSLGSDTLKDTLDIGGKALDVNMDPLHKTVEKSSKALKKTIKESSGTIKETLSVGTDALEAGKEALQSLGNRIKGLFQKKEKENKKDKTSDEP